MGGGLMQLVAYGAQDIYLTGNPQITFFKVVYRRHTNFSMEVYSTNLEWSRWPDCWKPVLHHFRNGDLVTRCISDIQLLMRRIRNHYVLNVELKLVVN